jgi:hypothetical protein
MRLPLATADALKKATQAAHNLFVSSETSRRRVEGRVEFMRHNFSKWLENREVSVAERVGAILAVLLAVLAAVWMSVSFCRL